MAEMVDKGQATSSIGASWPPVPVNNNRYRGFYAEGVVRSAESAREFVDAFYDYQNDAVASGCDRLSIRTVASMGSVALLTEGGVTLEGALPFERDGERMALVYAGWNDPDRSVPEKTYDAHRQLLGTIVRYPRREMTSQAILEQQEYIPQLINHETPLDERFLLADKFTDLYAAFGYDAADVRALLLNADNTIGYIERDGRIVSTAMAEAGVVDVGDVGPVHLVEMTEAFTRPDYRGRGLYEAISGYVLNVVMNERRDGLREADIIYGESNLAMPGVLYAARRNGRRFNHFDAARLGVGDRNFGILPQNVKVGDGTETRPYNDFALTYVELDGEAVS